MASIKRETLSKLKEREEREEREERRFVAERPRSAGLYARAKDSLLGGVPMN